MVFRNDPCPCGSGKKYKKCCLAKAKKEAAAQAKKAAASQPRDPLLVPTSQLAEMGFNGEIDDLEELDAVSNSVLDMIRTKNFDDALRTCARLIEDWPNFADGLERSGLVHEAMGNFEKAKDFYARVIAFTEQHDGFEDGGMANFMREKIAKIDARASAQK